jgi:hypothetical protein
LHISIPKNLTFPKYDITIDTFSQELIRKMIPMLSSTNLIKHFDISGLFPYNGWGNLLHGQVFVKKMQCDHLDLMENSYCERIGNTIGTITI